MTKTTLYPATVSQTNDTGNHYREFNNLGNVKNNKDTYAKTGQIATKSGTHNRPSAITAKNFKAKIPAGSKINSVTVEYAADYEGNISIGKSTINILNISGDNKNGKSLTKTMTKTSVTWKGDHTISNINSSDFGVKISFPANTKADVGYVKVKYIRIIIDYTVPNFSISAKKVSGTYQGDEYLVQCTLSNVNKTKGTSNVTINFPQNLGFIRQESGKGHVMQTPGTGPVKLTWTSEINGGSSSTVVLRVFPHNTGSFPITFKENASGHTTTLTLTAPEKPGQDEEGSEDSSETQTGTDETATPTSPVSTVNVLQVQVDEEFSLDLSFEDYTGTSCKIYACVVNENSFGASSSDWDNVDITNCTEDIWIYSVGQHQWAWRHVTIIDGSYVSPLIYDLTNLLMENNFKCSTPGEYVLAIYSSDGSTLLKKINLSVRPTTLTTPFLSIVKLTEEELNRLGDEVVYNVQSFIDIITSEVYVRNWGKNYRIGVFNNINPNIDTTPQIIDTIIDEETGDEISIDPIEVEAPDETDYENLTNQEIFNYAEYWSNPLTAVNNFTNISVDFPYDEKYPVYIIITGDYPESNINSPVEFTEPCIVESEVYNGYEVNGVYPLPIINLVDLSAEEPSTVTLDYWKESSYVIVYGLPLDENFGTNDELAVRGVEVTADIEYSDDLVIYAKLKTKQENTELIGNRSVILDSNSTELKIGGMYDTWGLDISKLVNLDKLEIELGIANILESAEGTLKLNNIQIALYVNPVEYTSVDVFVDDQNVAWYGMDVTDIDLPAGRNTETKYLNVDGTDMNVAYRQNIREKKIKLNFELDGCDLTETTAQLQQLSKLFTNKRDELNKPIPKKIEFSILPGKEFYYIMEDTFDNEIRVSDYKGSIELIIPDGTAFDVEDTVTNVTGYVDGIASVNPVIAVTHITSDQLTISEVMNDPDQIFKINKNNLTSDVTFDTNDIITIDCINRLCSIIKEGETNSTDISEAVDFNSDWFKIHGEFEFVAENCTIQTVTYNVRS